MTKVKQLFLSLLIITFSVNYGQSKSISNLDSTMTSYSINSTQVEEGDVNFSDGTNTLLRITDEGTFGAIEIKSGVPSITTNKLYNDNDTLKFNGNNIGIGLGVKKINDLSDAINTGSSLYLGSGSGINDNGNFKTVTGIGTNSLKSNISGTQNIAIGYNSLYSNTSGSYNSAGGSSALQNNSSGLRNSAFGTWSLYSNTSGNSNTSFGAYALRDNTTGGFNTATGYQTLFSNNTGVYNTADGTSALRYNTIGGRNTAIGASAMNNNKDGNYNTALGSNALYSNVSGTGNVAIGNNAAYNELGSDKLYIENSNSVTPLIWGDFAYNLATIHGNLGISTKEPTSKIDVNGSSGYNQLRLRDSFTPINSSDPNGEVGDTAWDEDYIYIKTNSGWKRTILETF